MKIHLTLIALTLTAAVAAQAQPASAGAASSSGLLGHRYAELSAGAIDPHGQSEFGFTSDVSVNLPVQPGLDVGFGYGYSRTKFELLERLFTQRLRDHTAYASATAYSEYRGVKPFFSAALGYQWSRSGADLGGMRVLDDRADEAVWGLAAGVEIPLGRVTLTPSISYQDRFDRDNGLAFVDTTNPPSPGSVGRVITLDRDGGAGFAYSVEASTWFTRTLGGFADVSYSDPTGGGTQSWTYKVGARLRF